MRRTEQLTAPRTPGVGCTESSERAGPGHGAGTDRAARQPRLLPARRRLFLTSQRFCRSSAVRIPQTTRVAHGLAASRSRCPPRMGVVELRVAQRSAQGFSLHLPALGQLSSPEEAQAPRRGQHSSRLHSAVSHIGSGCQCPKAGRAAPLSTGPVSHGNWAPPPFCWESTLSPAARPQNPSLAALCGRFWAVPSA